MRTKKEIMSEAAEPFNFDKVEQMQGYLLIEILCDIRDAIAGKVDMVVKTNYIEGDELPWRIEINNRFKGAAVSPEKAVMAALSAGHKIPREWRQE